MKHCITNYLCLAILLSTSFIHAVVPYIAFRSQSVSSDRDLVGETHLIKRFDKDEPYDVFAVTAEYQQTFRNHRLGRAYFGPTSNVTTTSNDCCDNDCDDSCDTYTISGTQVANRGANDWLADYFGLDPAFQGTFSISPKVKTFTLDFNLFLDLSQWCSNMYFKVHAPFVHVKNNLNFCEQVGEFTPVGYAPGYFSNNNFNSTSVISPTGLNQSFTDFIVDHKVPTLTNLVVFDPLKYAAISACGKSKNGVADLRAELGRNFILTEKSHFSLGILGAAPTGKRPHALYVFEPMIGNGKHWELGGALSCHRTFWRSKDELNDFGIYIDLNVTHIFKGNEIRTFDLKNKPLSRYMLAEKMNITVTNLFSPNGTAVPFGQFANKFSTVANLTTQEVSVSQGAQVDLSILLNHTRQNWSFDLGYNLWATSCEKIRFNCDSCTPLFTEKWALKGDAAVYGFTGLAYFALSATESKATINSGTNYPIGGALPSNVNGYFNANVDNSNTAFISNPVVTQLVTLPNGVVLQNTSSIPVLLTPNDIDFESARTKGLSNKLFGHISYSWNNHEGDWQRVPFVGIGANVEFASNHNDCTDDCSNETNNNVTDNDCSGCQRYGLTQWGIWIKGGYSF